MVNHISIGNAGEYFVAGELERRGFSVAVPMSNVELFDLLIMNRETKKQFAIQVKTNHSNKKEWIMTKKNENILGENIFYVFVCMNGLESPEYHIVPCDFVVKTISEGYQRWLNMPGRNGATHNETSVRKFEDYNNRFLDRWDLLRTE